MFQYKVNFTVMPAHAPCQMRTLPNTYTEYEEARLAAEATEYGIHCADPSIETEYTIHHVFVRN